MHYHNDTLSNARSGRATPKQADREKSIAAQQCAQSQLGTSVAGTGAPKPNPRDFGLMRVAYSVNETLSLLSIGRTSIYKLVAQGALKPAKLGKKTLFYASDIAALLIKLREAACRHPP